MPGQASLLQYWRSDDSGATFPDPIAIGADQPATIAKRGMDAQIAAAGDHVVAVWPTAGTDKMGRGPMATAFSTDAGRTWRAGPNPADDGLTIGHSFIDLAAGDDGTFHLVWLDSREATAKGLRYARSTDGGATWSRNQTLDAETCECCWNTLAVGSDGTVAVLYRDANPRDMAMIRSSDGGKSWSSPVRVGAFDWNITACPHVGARWPWSRAPCTRWCGPRVTRKSTASMRLAPPTQAQHGLRRCAWARTRPRGRTWPSHPTARLVAAWDAGLDIFVSESTDDGRTWSAPRQIDDLDPTTQASATHARLLCTAAGVRAFWTESRPRRPARWTSRLLP